MLRSRSFSAKRIITFLGIALGLGLTLYFLITMDWQACAELLKNLLILPVIGACATIICTSIFRALRWYLLVSGSSGSTSRNSKFRELLYFWQAVCLGYLGNMVLPAKAGEGLRMLYLYKKTERPAPLILSTGIMDRMFDVLGIMVPIALVFFFSIENTILSQLRWVFPALAAVFLLCFVALAVVPARMRQLLSLPVYIMPKVYHERYLSSLDRAMSVSAALRNPGIAFLLILLTLLAVGTDCLTCWFLFKAFGWNFGLLVAMFMEIAFAVGGSLPSAPGYLGTYQVAAVLVLSPFGVAKSLAVLYAFAVQFVVFIVFAVLGGGTIFHMFWNKQKSK